MPKRKRILRVPSPEMQGEDSWVLVAQMTVEEMREARKAAKKDDFDAFELGVTILKTHVLEWNWVDDNDKALPMPKDEPGIIDALTDDEVGFLSECIQGSESNAKN